MNKKQNHIWTEMTMGVYALPAYETAVYEIL